MDLEILPNPSEAERKAIVIALQLEANENHKVSEWSRGALPTIDAQEDMTTVRPHSARP